MREKLLMPMTRLWHRLTKHPKEQEIVIYNSVVICKCGMITGIGDFSDN